MDFDDLPDSWAIATVEETGEYINGFAFKPSDWKDQGIPIIRIQNLTSTAKEFNYTDKIIDQKYLIKDKDILVSWSATLGAFMWKGQDAYLNQHIFKVIPNTNLINKNFLYHLLNIVIGEMINGEHLHGSTMKHINRQPFLSHPVLIPPLNEQKRIVEKIELIQERTKIVKRELENIKVLLKKLRRSLLASAFRGDLTKDWRANHPDIEPAEVLLENILDNNLPEKWFVTEIGNIIENLRYGTSKKCDYQVNGIGVLRIPNIVNGSVDCTDLKYTELTPQEMQSVNLIAGDLLMIRSNGSPSLVGRTALITELENNLSYAGYLIRIRPNQKLVDPAYLNLWFSSDKIRFQIEMPLRSTNGINNINSSEVKGLTIPLPPLEEQKEIVRKLEKMMKFADQVEERVKEAEKKLEKFNQSVLAKAFRGKLVPQDINDEPASVLLGKIQQEKNKTTSKKTKK